MTESWRAVPGYEGAYEVSDQGRVRSLDRVVLQKNGHVRTVKGRVLRPNRVHSYHAVCLGTATRRRVGQLVLEAFIGPCPPGMEACHKNDIGTDDRLTNLRWDTPSANGFDQVRNGGNFQAAKTHCKHGHEFTPENTWRNGRWRQCRICLRRRARETKARKRLAA